MKIRTVRVLAVLGRRRALGRVRSQMIPVRVVLVHRRERVPRERAPGTGESRLRPLMLIRPSWLPALMATQATDVLGELVRTGHVVSAGITRGPQSARIVQIVVLELDEGGLAAL